MNIRMRRLFFHEMRSNLWFLLIGLITMGFNGTYLYRSVVLAYVNAHENYYFYRHGSIISENISNVLQNMSITFFIGLAIMTIFQFYSQKVGTTTEFMNGLPYRKNELLGMKYFSGILTITIPTILYAVECLIIRNTYIHEILRLNIWSVDYEYTKANETIEVLLLNILLFWLSCIALYSIYMLMQVMIHPPIVAMVVGMLTAMIPYYLFHQLRDLVSIFTDKPFETEYDLKLWFGSALGQSQWPSHSGIWNSNEHAVLVVFKNITYYIIIFTTVFIITILLSFIMNKKQETASRRAFSYPIIEKIFLICLGICSGLVVFSIPDVMKFGRIFMIAMLLIVSGMSIFLVKKAIERYSS